MALNLAKAVLEALKARPEEKLTSRQRAEWIFSAYPAECQEKKSNSRSDNIKTDGDLVQQFPITTHSAQTRMNTECGVDSAREAMAGNRANTGASGKKIPTDKGWDLKL